MNGRWMSVWVDGSMAREPCERFDKSLPEPNTDKERLPEEFRRFWSFQKSPGDSGASFWERLESLRERLGSLRNLGERLGSLRERPGSLRDSVCKASGSVWEASGSFWERLRSLRERLGSLQETVARQK